MFGRSPFPLIKGLVVEVSRLARGSRALGGYLGEVEPLSDGAGRIVSVGDLLGYRGQQARLLAWVVPVGQHRAVLEQAAVPLDHQVGDGVQQRVTRREKLG